MRPSRVVVLLDASPHALRALEAAAELARRYRVPLLAVSVDEPDRARSAGYPFAREVCAVSGTLRPVAAAGSPAGSAAGIRRIVEQATHAAELAWDVVVLRGRLVEEVLALSRPGDCLLLGRVGWSARLGRRLGGSPLTLARRSAALVQIVPDAVPRQRGRVAVLVESVAAARAVLAVAAARAEQFERELVVLLAPSVEEQAIVSLLGGLKGGVVGWRLYRLPAIGSGAMLQSLAEQRAAELVVGREEWLDSPAVARLLACWPMPVLVVPAGGEA